MHFTLILLFATQLNLLGRFAFISLRAHPAMSGLLKHHAQIPIVHERVETSKENLFANFSAERNCASGGLEFLDRRTSEPTLGARSLSSLCSRTVYRHVRDFSSRVILRGCAARVGMSAGTQANGYERLRLPTG